MSKDYKLKPCSNCGAETRNKVFCSKACSGNRKTLDGIYKVIMEGNFPPNAWTVRRYLELMFGWRCSICSKTEWMGNPIPLVMDHIDGNSENWSVDNIRLVCANCDAQLPTYKGRNKGNGRFNRAKRYRLGLSY